MWLCVFIDDCVLGQRILECSMKNLRDERLTIVVINFYRIKYLEFL